MAVCAITAAVYWPGLSGLLIFDLARSLFGAISRPARVAKKGRRPASGFSWLFMLCPLIALFSKENGTLTPVLALLVELLFFRFRGPEGIRRMLLVYFGTLTALALGLIGLAMVDRGFIRAGYAGRGFTFGQPAPSGPGSPVSRPYPPGVSPRDPDVPSGEPLVPAHAILPGGRPYPPALSHCCIGACSGGV
ncbi:MAG: hypothetical protein ACYCS1_08600 [Gammaproteobacteria bacterium]